MIIDELSRAGFSGTVPLRPLAVQVGCLLRVCLPNGHTPHARVAWVDEGRSGCEFISPLTDDDVLVCVALGPPGRAAPNNKPV